MLAFGDLIEDAQCESDPETANDMLCDAEQIARQLHQIEPDNAEYCYAVALTYYHRRGSQDVHGKCLEWLNKAEELAPAHPWVPLFRGYQYFDENRFLEAHSEFARVNQDYFANIGQNWRNIKTDELKIVSLIRGGSEAVDYRVLVRLVDRYIQADELDRPVPVEIVGALSDSVNRTRFTSSPRDVAAEVCRLIRACDAGDLFPRELAVLDATSKSIG